MEEEVAKVSIIDGIIVGGYLNGHIGLDRKGFDDLFWPYDFVVAKREGKTMLEFAKNQNL